MGGIKTVERAEALLGEAGTNVLGYQLGCLYPGFQGASRARLAEIFEKHGFAETAKTRILDIDPARAVSAIVSRVGRARRDGLQVHELSADDSESHVRAWGVHLVTRRPREKQPDFKCGARVFVFNGDIYTAKPVEADEISEARKLAEQIAEDARRLLVIAATSDISRAVSHAIEASGALSFISRGAYLAVNGFPGTDRIVALFRDLRSEFYDEEQRIGLRCSAIAVTDVDRDAVSDSVLDDLEERIQAAAARLRVESAGGTVRVSTIEARRKELADLAQQAKDRAAWLGSRGGRLGTTLEALQQAYSSAVDAATLKFPEELAELVPSEATSDSAPPPAPESRPDPEVQAAPEEATPVEVPAKPEPAAPPVERGLFDY